MEGQYKTPTLPTLTKVADDVAVLVASGDLRIAANQTCWAAQKEMEAAVIEAFKKEGITVQRGHQYDETQKHGFISSQKQGMDVFAQIHPDAKLIVAEAVWQYSHHVLAGLYSHRGPILTVANWAGEWPGLVGLLNLNASLTKMNKPFSTIWSKDFTDDFFLNGIRQWIKEGTITHDLSHVHPLPDVLPKAEEQLGIALAQQLKHNKSILGVFDEGCMGMYNAIIDDVLLNQTGIFKERLSQSSLLAEMERVSESEANAAREWLDKAGMKFVTGTNEETDLTENQILGQLKMYIAAVRIADEFGCGIIGIQYQQGLKDMAPASDLAEGIMNNVERPPVYHRVTGNELFAGAPCPHFNEVDEGAGVDILVTNRVWTAMNLDPATTLHDIRWGEHYKGPNATNTEQIDAYVWVFEISGSVPPSHFENGYKDAVGERQPAMYFRLGGSSIKGISKPGSVVWSRVFVMDNKLHADLGRVTSVSLPLEETQRRWNATTPQWPIMHAVTHGVSRDQLMARHKANHLNVAYAPNEETTNRALFAKAAMFKEMGIEVHILGDVVVPT